MKKIVVLIVLILTASLLIGAKPPERGLKKHPKKVNLDIVNKSGEQVIVTLVGTGYDFQDGTFGNDWGPVRYGFYYVTVEGNYIVTLPTKETVEIPQAEVVRNLKVLKDLYVVSVTYETEFDGTLICLNNWTPQKYEGEAGFFAAPKIYNKLVIRKCDEVPSNLGAPAAGITKFNRAGLSMYWEHWLIVK